MAFRYRAICGSDAHFNLRTALAFAPPAVAGSHASLLPGGELVVAQNQTIHSTALRASANTVIQQRQAPPKVGLHQIGSGLASIAAIATITVGLEYTFSVVLFFRTCAPSSLRH
jgi:hypothetical protein